MSSEVNISDPAIAAELERLNQLDGGVPLRATRGHAHHTWARTFHSSPELFIQPETLEEVEKAIKLARQCRKRITTVGSGHSPSDMTCTSSWMMNLDKFNKILSVNKEAGVVTMQAGIRLYQLEEELDKLGLAMPNLGSINEQSIAGAISTGTHGSTLRHSILSSSVTSLRITLSDSRTVFCSPDENEELFRAALCSLGALGVVTEITFQAVPAFNLHWSQTVYPDSHMLDNWTGNLWTQAEFVRVWWFPYTRRSTVWKASKTDRSPKEMPFKPSYYDTFLGYHIYHNLLYIAHYVPKVLPWVEWFVFGMQFGFSTGPKTTVEAIQPSRQALLMNCLYSQFVNEWALPLEKGPIALRRLSSWLNGLTSEDPDYVEHGIPYSADGIYVHAPIEVRVTDTTIPLKNNDGTPRKSARPYLDSTSKEGATLYLNATLYRPYNMDPPCRVRYYQAFEYLMRELGGKPHWAKNFETTGKEIEEMYRNDILSWRRVRDEADPEGMFTGPWHRRYLLGDDQPRCEMEEVESQRVPLPTGGVEIFGELSMNSYPAEIMEEYPARFDLVAKAEIKAQQDAKLKAQEDDRLAKIAAEKKAKEDRIAAAKKAEQSARLAAEKKREEKRLAEEKSQQELAELKRQEEAKAEAARSEALRVQTEKEDMERMDQTKMDEEAKEAARLEAVRVQKEKEERERLEQIKRDEAKEAARLEAVKVQTEKEERERLEKERLETERLEKLEKERLERERHEKLENERLEGERLERERLERERLEKERLESERVDQTKRKEEARIAEGKRKEEERIKEVKRVAEEKRKEEERIKEEKRVAEEKRMEEERIKEAKRVAEEKRMEEERIKEAKRVAEEKRKEEERIKEEKRLALEKKKADEKRAADDKKKAERLALEKKKAEAEVKKRHAQEQQTRSKAAREAEVKESKRIQAEKLAAARADEKKQQDAKIAEEKLKQQSKQTKKSRRNRASKSSAGASTTSAPHEESFAEVVSHLPPRDKTSDKPEALKPTKIPDENATKASPKTPSRIFRPPLKEASSSVIHKREGLEATADAPAQKRIKLEEDNEVEPTIAVKKETTWKPQYRPNSLNELLKEQDRARAAKVNGTDGESSWNPRSRPNA